MCGYADEKMCKLTITSKSSAHLKFAHPHIKHYGDFRARRRVVFG